MWLWIISVNTWVRNIMFTRTAQPIQLNNASSYSLLNNLFSFAIYLFLFLWPQPLNLKALWHCRLSNLCNFHPGHPNAGKGWSFQYLCYGEFLLFIFNWMITPYGRAELKYLNMQLERLLFSLASQAAFQMLAQQKYHFFPSESLWMIWCVLNKGEFSTTWLKNYIPWRREWRKQV